MEVGGYALAEVPGAGRRANKVMRESHRGLVCPDLCPEAFSSPTKKARFGRAFLQTGGEGGIQTCYRLRVHLISSRASGDNLDGRPP
jgi:hypothetical protein